MVSENVKRNLVKLVTLGIASFVVYRLAKGDSPQKAVMKTVDVIEESTVGTVKKIGKNLVKGSSEAKKRMAELRAKRTKPGRPVGSKGKKTKK